MFSSPSATPTPQRPALDRTQRALERAAAAGVIIHALFLPISIAGMQIGLGIALGALLALRMTGRKIWTRSALDLPLLILCAAALVSLGMGSLAGSPPVGLHEATLWRSALSPIVLLSAIEVNRGAAGRQDDGAPRRLALAALAVWAAASCLPSVLAWFQYWTGFDPLFAMGVRSKPVRAIDPHDPTHFAAVGFFKWYQRLAHNIIPPAALAASVALNGSGGTRRLRWLLGASAALAVSAVVFTLSRAAWASVLLAGLFIAVAQPRLRRGALVAALAVCVAGAMVPGVRARVAAMGDNADRRAIWGVCAAAVRERPLTGVGWGNLPNRAASLYAKLPAEYKVHAWCHNSFFSAWAEGGPILFGALAAYWVLLARAFLRWRQRAVDQVASAGATGAIAALAAMLLNSLFHDILYASEGMYGLGFALGIGAALVLSRPGVARRERSP